MFSRRISWAGSWVEAIPAHTNRFAVLLILSDAVGIAKEVDEPVEWTSPSSRVLCLHRVLLKSEQLALAATRVCRAMGVSLVAGGCS